MINKQNTNNYKTYKCGTALIKKKIKIFSII